MPIAKSDITTIVSQNLNIFYYRLLLVLVAFNTSKVRASTLGQGLVLDAVENLLMVDNDMIDNVQVICSHLQNLAELAVAC